MQLPLVPLKAFCYFVTYAVVLPTTGQENKICFTHPIFQTDCYLKMIRLDFFCPDYTCITIGMCCHGNSVSVSYYVQWWCTFPTQKHEKWRSIIFPCEQSQRWDVEQTIFFSGTSQTIVRCCLHIALLGAAWILLSHSDAVLWLWTSCSRYVSTHLLNPLWAAREADWDASVEIRFESQYKPPPSVVWISFEKISFHMFQSSKRQILADSLNIVYT